MGLKYSFKAKLWIYSGEGAWYFVTLPKEYATEIREITDIKSKKGFGSIRTRAEIGDVAWNTSIFPDSKSKSYLLPIKKEIRQQCGLEEGDTTEISIEISVV